MAHDIATSHRLTKYGGHGYAHILENVMPIMRRKGFLARRLIRYWSGTRHGPWPLRARDKEAERIIVY